MPPNVASGERRAYITLTLLEMSGKSRAVHLSTVILVTNASHFWMAPLLPADFADILIPFEAMSCSLVSRFHRTHVPGVKEAQFSDSGIQLSGRSAFNGFARGSRCNCYFTISLNRLREPCWRGSYVEDGSRRIG
jgi:hypothetical protein